MKTIEELGISPTPWTLGSLIIGSDGLYARSSVDDSEERVVVGDSLVKEEDARIIAAAPKLYECLLNAVIDRCCDCLNHVGWTCESDEDCPVKKWRAALAEAAGEEAFDE